MRVIEMTEKVPAGWHAYSEVGELLTELDLTGEDMARAKEATDDHIRAWHLAMVRTEQDRTHDDVAQAMGVTQLGGKLRVVADFGDQEYRIT
jgi:hypothetical protein